MNRVLMHILILILLAPLVPYGPAPVGIQAAVPDYPGVRGSLYESPSFGWTLLIDPAWSVDDATSDDEVDTLTLSVNTLPGVSASVFIQSFPGDEQDCLRGTTDQLEDAWPGAVIEPAVDASGGEATEGIEVIYSDLITSSVHWVSAYLAWDLPNYDGEVVVEADCVPIERTDGVVRMLAVMPVEAYAESADFVDTLRDTYVAPGIKRTSAARPGGTPPLVGVLEFNREHDWRLKDEMPSAVTELFGEYRPPDEPLPPGKAYVLHTSWVANIDARPAVLQLGALVGRFPPGEEGASDRSYTMRYYAWLAGVSPDASESVMLAPGESAVYLAWFVVDIPESEHAGTARLQVTYEPVEGGVTDVMDTSFIDGPHQFRPLAGGGGGGARPRVRLGN